MAEQQFTSAPGIRSMAQELIEQYHQHLSGRRIEYIFSAESITSKGRPVWAQVRKVASIAAFLSRPDRKQDASEPFFAIVFCKKTWENGLTDKQRVALVDHELQHCGVDDKGTLFLAHHDIEEFSEIAQRHGAWNKSQVLFYDVWRQQAGLSANGGNGGGETGAEQVAAVSQAVPAG